MRGDATRRPLTKRQRNALEWIAWGEVHFGSLTTGRNVRRSTIATLVERGLVVSAGLVLVCDEEGSALDPERWREGFKLTASGRAAAAAVVRERDAVLASCSRGSSNGG